MLGKQKTSPMRNVAIRDTIWWDTRAAEDGEGRQHASQGLPLGETDDDNDDRSGDTSKAEIPWEGRKQVHLEDSEVIYMEEAVTEEDPTAASKPKLEKIEHKES